MAGDCETEISRRIFNPDKSLQAISMVTGCGATTSPSYGVRIVESSDIIDEGVPDNTILGSNTGVGIKWVSNDTLLITGADTTNGYTMKTHLKMKKTNTNIIILYADYVNQKNDSLQQDSSLYKANRIFNNPFRDINNFDIKVGNQTIDSLHTEYLKTIDPTITKDICIGDNCESYQTFINKDNHSILYFFKGDGGEYGFSNDQYHLKNDSLNFVRNFNVNVAIWPTDTTKTVWRVEEITYKFQGQTVSCNRKTALTKDLDGFDFMLRKRTSEIIKASWKVAYQNKTKELEKLLALKDSKDRD